MIAMMLAAAGAGAAAAGWVRPVLVPRRSRPSVPSSRRPPRRAPRQPVGPMVVRCGCLAAGGLMVLAGAGLLGVILGGSAAVIVPTLVARDEPRELRRTRAVIAAELPTAVGLLAATLAAGADPATCLAGVAAAVGGTTGERLQLVATELRLGAPPDAAWAAAIADGGDPLAPVRDAFAAAGDDGSALAVRLARLADSALEAAAATSLAAAERVGVRAVLPLGLCFLPAFVAVGVVPVVAAALGGLRL